MILIIGGTGLVGSHLILECYKENLKLRVTYRSKEKLNKYKKKVGTTLRFWENKGWMRESHPYGWVQWYCDYYSGKRSADDDRQIKRWLQYHSILHHSVVKLY